jgi:hypothetical protein
MARLDSASRLRWPRRIMVSMTSLRNRLAAAPSPSSPVRSRYSQAIWKDSSSNWEREIVMGGKRTRTARVPCHLRFAARFPSSTATGSDRKTTSPRTWVSDVSKASQTAKRGSRQSRPKASCMDELTRPLPRCPLRLPRLSLSVLHRQAEHVDKPQPVSLLCAKRPEPPGGRMDSSRQERSRC